MNFRELPVRSGSGSESSTKPKNLTIEDGGELDGTKRVRVIWGLMNNIQSDQFTAGDRVPLYFNVGGEGTIYAVQTVNLKTRQWTKAEVKMSTSLDVPSDTKSTKITTLGTFSVVNNVLYVVSREGGDIESSFCELSVN